MGLNKSILQKFGDRLKEHRSNLLNWFGNVPEQKQVQCCCSDGTINEVIEKHDRAIREIDSGDFGKCKLCEGEVEVERLEIDFTTQVCLSHYSEDELQVLQHDLELAAKVQQQLLPHQIPVLKGIQIAVHTEPAKIVSGDYFDFFSYQDGSQGIAVADVMGKGLPASMLMSNLQASLRILGPENCELHKLAGRLNDLFKFNIKLISFITLFLLKIDTESKTIQFCNAGHNPAMFYDSKSKLIRRLNSTGPAIGLIPNSPFESETFSYKDGDLLLLFTDGIPEARNTNNEEFGEGRIESYLKQNLDKLPEIIISQLRQQAKSFGGELQDDATLLVIKF